MKHIETIKKIQKNVNKHEISEIHEIRGAYGLPCGTCVYSDYCRKNGYNKENFHERISENE